MTRLNGAVHIGDRYWRDNVEGNDNVGSLSDRMDGAINHHRMRPYRRIKITATQ